MQKVGTGYGPLLPKCQAYWNNLKEVLNLITHTYRVIPAHNEELQKAAYQVRHKVYCSELNYEASNAARMETDEYDHHSSHMVVYSQPHKAYIGCLRLIHGRHNGQHHELPFEHHCKDTLDHRIITMVKESGYKYAEVSRLAIDKDFRHIRRKSASSLGAPKKSSVILLSLYLGLQALARQQNVRYLFAIVEPRLLRNLHRHCIPAVQIGEGVDHRGLRVPILIDVEDIEKIIPSLMRPLYNIIRRDIESLIPHAEEPIGAVPVSLAAYMAENSMFSVARKGTSA